MMVGNSGDKVYFMEAHYGLSGLTGREMYSDEMISVIDKDGKRYNIRKYDDYQIYFKRFVKNVQD